MQVIDLVAAPKPWRRLYLPEDDQFRGSVTTIDLDSENLNSFNIWKRGHLVYQAVHKRSFNRPDWCHYPTQQEFLYLLIILCVHIGCPYIGRVRSLSQKLFLLNIMSNTIINNGLW